LTRHQGEPKQELRPQTEDATGQEESSVGDIASKDEPKDEINGDAKEVNGQKEATLELNSASEELINDQLWHLCSTERQDYR